MSLPFTGISSWCGPAPGPATVSHRTMPAGYNDLGTTTWVQRRGPERQLVDHRDAHRPGGAGDDLDGGVDVLGVEVFHLALGDGPELLPVHLGDFGLVRFGRSLAHRRRL